MGTNGIVELSEYALDVFAVPIERILPDEPVLLWSAELKKNCIGMFIEVANKI